MESELLNAAILFAAAGATAMILMCLTLLRWWHREVTLTAVAISVAVLLAILPSLLHTLLGVSTTTRWFTWYRICSDLLVGGVEFWRGWVIYKVQRRGGQ